MPALLDELPGDADEADEADGLVDVVDDEPFPEDDGLLFVSVLEDAADSDFAPSVDVDPERESVR